MQNARKGARFALALAIALGTLAAACNALLDFESFSVGTADGGGGGLQDGRVPPDAGADDGGCIDPAGFGGRGCWRCPPTNNVELLSACTRSSFETFDNAARITNFDPGVPRPALEDAGPNPPDFDAGGSGGGGSLTDAACPFADPNLPNPVLVMGASGFPLETVAKAMGNEATIYYREESSCLGVGGAVQNTPKMSGPNLASANYGYITYFDKSLTPVVSKSCRLEQDMQPDVYLSALFPESCAGAEVARNMGQPVRLGATPALNSGYEDFFGVVNPVMFAVPGGSSERSVTAEAAYRIYGFGSKGTFGATVAPWIDESFIFRRTSSSGTQQSVARSLLLAIDALRGVNSTGASAMRRAFQQSTAPAKTIGISTSEIVDIDRDSMKSLAYQHYGQPVAFYPDSEPGLLDRRNVRDGHYFLWIPLHIFVKTNQGDPAASNNTDLETIAARTKPQRDAAVKQLVFVMANRAPAPVTSIDLFGAIKRVGNVPTCAMRVTRSKEGADLTPLVPSASCACAFESAAPRSPGVECIQCKSPGDCTAIGKATCSFGYCE